MITTKINISPDSDFAGTEFAEETAAKKLRFAPTPPIVVKSYVVHDLENFSGSAVMELSNGHKIEYDCKEVHGAWGPDCVIDITVTDRNGRRYKSHFDADSIDEFLTCDTIASSMFHHYKNQYLTYELS